MPSVQQRTGRYHLLRLISSGRRFEVYLAEDRQIKQLVAIKLFRSAGEETSQSAAVDRLFHREADAIMGLNHPNILPLFDYGQEYFGKTLMTYMVMPFCKDGSFADWLSQHREPAILPLQDIARLIGQAADALQYAHNHQVIHQNVKPSSFFIHNNKEHPSSPDLLLANFGLAKFAGTDAETTCTVRGTPAYMAPEQWSGRPVPATDQYALAAMAYELLTGRLPFKGDQRQLMNLHFYTGPLPPGSLNSQIQPAVDTVILRALAKKPEERFPSISEFAHAFQQALLSTPQQLSDSVSSITSHVKQESNFDVFLCHNGEDKPAVKEIGKQLKEHGIIPWLDEWELRPGLPWQPVLEQQIGQIKSAAVFVGQAGIGPWHQMELYAFLSEFARRGCPVIPVLLPDAPTEPHLPLFLHSVTWVDFRKQEPDPIEQLIWGITGKHNILRH